MEPFRYSDLLGLGYRAEEMDLSTGFASCSGVCREVLRRLGFDPSIMPATTTEVAVELASVSPPELWEFLGRDASAARELGDTVASLTPTGAHVFTLVQERPPRVISAAEGSGVYTIRPSLIRGVVGVWRPQIREGAA